MLFKTAVNSIQNTQRLNYSYKSVNTIKESNRWLWLSREMRQHAVREKYKVFYYPQLTTWSAVFLKKLTAIQLVKKLPAYCWTRRFITAFTTAPHLSLLWAISIQSMPSSHFLKIHFSIILPSPVTHTCHVPRPSHLDSIARNNIWWGMQTSKLLVM